MKDYNQNQRLQEFIKLADPERKLNAEQLSEAAEDFYEFEEQEGEMSLDIFKERLKIRLIPEPKLYRDIDGKIEPFRFKLNDPVKSKVTGNCGIIQGTYGDPNDLFMVFCGYKNGYEHFKESEMILVTKEELPFRYDLYKVES